MKKFLLWISLFCSLYSRADIVVLDSASVEIFYLLGAEDRISAIASLKFGKIYPYEKTKNLPSVGTYAKPSLEKIVALNPSLVILNRYSTNLKEDLERLHIKSIFLEANSLEQILDNIKTIAQITNKKQKAQELIGSFKTKLQKIREKPLNQKGVFFHSSAPLMAFGKDTLAGDILLALGIKNIAGDSIGLRPILNQEFILKENPDFIMYGLGLKDTQELYKTNPLLTQTNAVKRGHIFFLSASALLRGSPRVIEEIEKLHQQLQNIQ